MMLPVLRRLPAMSLVVACLCVPRPAVAQGEDEIATDRPDFVESSRVVGPNRFQIETSVAAERARGDPVRVRTVSTPTLLRFGVGERAELRVETDGRMVERMSPAPLGTNGRSAGYADVALGVKFHLQDDAPGVPSVGLLLHADLASGSAAFHGSGVRPSARLVAEWDLPAGLGLGVMPGIGVEPNGNDARHRYGILGVVLGREITPTLRGLVELALPHIARVEAGGTNASVDVGAAWLLSRRCQLDAMLSFGLNRRTPDIGMTAGLSFKL